MSHEFKLKETTDGQHSVSVDDSGLVIYYKKGNYGIFLNPDTATELGEHLLHAASKAARIGPRYAAHIEEDVARDTDYQEFVKLVVYGKAPN